LRACSRIALGIRLLRRRSQRKNGFHRVYLLAPLAELAHAPAGSARRRAIPDARRLCQLSRLANVSQQASPGTQTIVDERTQERPDYRVEEGDHERFSHYVAKDKLTEAMVLGTPVVALCGKVWVPSRDPERFPVCPECREIWESLDPGADD
jgi:Protein of unknown function (DUF3039)